jgi:tRNA threonylcarbamoyl adenosine modification protein YeaZ
MTAAAEGLLLAIDTATSLAVVAVGDRAGRLLAEDRWIAGFRHGEELLARLDALLVAERSTAVSIAALVVGTGPGGFTGLRVGVATVKGLALALGRPVVGIPTGLALLDASREDAGPAPAVLLMPAGPSDRILVRRTASEGRPAAVRLGPGESPDEGSGELTGSLVAVDLDGRADEAACERGRRAQAGLGRALLRLGADRLTRHGPDDLAALVPEYVTLPRGIARETGRVVVGPA